MDTLLHCIIKIIFSRYSLTWLRVRSGDFAAVFVEEMTRLKSRFWSEDRPGPLMATWRFQSDADGFMVQLTGADFEQIRAMLKKLYGPAEVTESARGHIHGLYREQDIGLFIRFVDEGDAVLIMVARRPKRR